MSIKSVKLALSYLSGCVLIFILGISWQRADAEELYQIHKSIRSLGMGGAGVASTFNSDVLFINPAGLADVRGMNFTMMDPYVGLSGLDILEQAQSVQNSADFSATLQQFYGSPAWLGGGAKAAALFSNVGFAYYTDVDASLRIDNPVFPELQLNVVQDYGLALGAGFQVHDNVSTGVVIKQINRKGVRETYRASTIGDLNPDQIFGNLDNAGKGYSADLGVNLIFDRTTNATMSFVWKDIGTTKFRVENGGVAPPSDPDEMIVGLAATIDGGLFSITPALDFRGLNRNDVPIGKKVNFGVEVGLPLLDVRAGFHQGYYTLGAGLNVGLLRVEAATYGVELGEYPGQLEDRRYLLQIALEFGVDSNWLNFSGNQGRRNRLKQRR
ncbi:MAG: hypothetical protein H6624_08525 [Bdellovibrionaceae bacterium]|nr:hypothetical protein [Bdellovibrionales bacterium]MCB9084377.1 hypothetical protein [Pseudobdellovibrionaceae bacterium]